jgi:hypothetical protein
VTWDPKTNGYVGHLHEEGLQPLAVKFYEPSGNKSWLRRRLHAAIVREYLEDAMDDE